MVAHEGRYNVSVKVVQEDIPEIALSSRIAVRRSLHFVVGGVPRL